MKRLVRFIIILCLILGITACSDEKNNLTEAIEDAWDMIEDDIETSADEMLEELEENPNQLYKGNCETDYISLGHIFTLRIPIDYTSQAAINLIFGDEFGQLMSTLDSAGRNSKSKEDVRKLIIKHFNSSWFEMFTALIILDGEFDYDFETDSWLDNSYDFNAKSLYKILNDKGYFEGGYGDELPSEEEEEMMGYERKDEQKTRPAVVMGFKNGYNELSGNMIHKDGRKFPFGLSFTYNSSTGEFEDILYTNIGSGTKLRLTAQMMEEDKLRMEGKDGGKDFILIFKGSGPYTGDAWWGDFHQDVELQ